MNSVRDGWKNGGVGGEARYFSTSQGRGKCFMRPDDVCCLCDYSEQRDSARDNVDMISNKILNLKHYTGKSKIEMVTDQ